MIETDEQSSQASAGPNPAERLIRALRAPEAGDDQVAWTARWASLLEDCIIDDAEAAKADLIINVNSLENILSRMRTGEVFATRRSHISNLLRVRRSQLNFLHQWIKSERQFEIQEETAHLRAEAQRLITEAQRLKTERVLKQQESLKTTQDVRAYKRAIYERERQVARDRIALVQNKVPDVSDPVMMVQAARHVIVKLKSKLRASGIDNPLEGNDLEVDHALQGWLESQSLEEAVKQVDREFASEISNFQ